MDCNATDGDLNGTFVAYGEGEEAEALHAFCWRALGSPTTTESHRGGKGSHGWSMISRYQQQLFLMRELRDEGKAWCLVDPSANGPEARRNSKRIAAMIEFARQPRGSALPNASVKDLLAKDDDWRMALRSLEGKVTRVHRYRSGVKPGLDVAGYPHLVWLFKRYTASVDPEAQRPVGPAVSGLDELEHELKAAVEGDGAAIMVAAMLARGEGQYVFYARDEAECVARLEGVAGSSEFENERDEGWAVYFDQVLPSVT